MPLQIVEGWRKLNILGDYHVEDSGAVFTMIPISTDSEHSSISPTTDRRQTSFLTQKKYRSKGRQTAFILRQYNPCV